MAELIEALNFDPANIKERTALDADAAAGQTDQTVKNVNGFGTDSFVLNGRPGAEKSEIGVVDSIAGRVITLNSNLSYAHKKFDEVRRMFGDKIKIYRAANVDDTEPADGDFAELTELTIEADKLTSSYTDDDGGVDYWYKQTYYNSLTLEETSLEDSTAMRGGDYGHYATLNEVREEAGFEDNPDITDSLVDDYRAMAEGKVKSALHYAGYTMPLAMTPSVVRMASRLIAAGMILNKDYGQSAEGTTKEGNAKIEEGEKLLKQIKDDEIVLVNEQDERLARTTKGATFSGWPDSTTEDTKGEDGGGVRKFRMTDVF